METHLTASMIFVLKQFDNLDLLQQHKNRDLSLSYCPAKNYTHTQSRKNYRNLVPWILWNLCVISIKERNLKRSNDAIHSRIIEMSNVLKQVIEELNSVLYRIG